jgi:hypothetical protein
MLAMATKVGRPRRKGVPRYKGGQIVHADRGERPEDVMGVVVAYRQKHLGAKEFKDKDKVVKVTDARWGYALGRLWLMSAITEEQHDILCKFINLYTRNAILRGWPTPNLKSASAILIAKGESCAPEAEEDRINNLRRDWESAYRCIHATQDGLSFESIKLVCIEDRDPQPQHFGPLRVVANALAHLWKTPRRA